MAIVIRLSFPAGRYHATPWGRHVNEGVPEWPPSPWRLLRGLVAAWKRTCPDISDDLVQQALVPLTETPLFRLPPHRVAHTRHYMPWEKKGPADRTLVFDTFVSVSRKEDVFIGWPEATLPPGVEASLRRLVGNLTSLGRAEGWVEAEISPPDQHVEWNCKPSDDDPNPVRVFCADPQSAFGDQHYPTVKPRAKPQDRLFDCPRWHLCLDTETIHGERWPTVPGSRWVNYTRPIEQTATRTRRPVRMELPTVARFVIDGKVLPLVTETVRVAERFRRALMSRFSSWCREHPEQGKPFARTDDPHKFSSRTISGKDSSGQMETDHGHAFYLPTADGEDRRRITHLTVIAKDGFSPEEVAALTSLRRLRETEKEGELFLQLVGLGREDDFNHWLLKESSVWTSATPFVGPAHIGRHGQKRFMLKAVRREVRRMIEKGELPVGASLLSAEALDAILGLPRPFDFKRYRDRRGGFQQRPVCFVRLTFHKPVPRPGAFGYGSHFGLGMLAPE